MDALTAPTFAQVVGARLRYVRRLRGLSQARLARRLGLGDDAQIGQAELGRRCPTARNLYRYAVALRVRSDFLLGLCDDARQVRRGVPRPRRRA